MTGDAIGANHLPGRVFAVLAVEHGLILALGLLSLAWPGPPGPSVAIVAFGTVGLVISSVGFARRLRSPLWPRVASAAGLIVAAVVAGFSAVTLSNLVRAVSGPCYPSSSECEGLLGLEGYVMSLALVCVVYLAFLGVLAAHWFRNLGRGA